MGADVFDGIVFSFNVCNAHLAPLDLYHLQLALGYLGGGCYPDEVLDQPFEQPLAGALRGYLTDSSSSFRSRGAWPPLSRLGMGESYPLFSRGRFLSGGVSGRFCWGWGESGLVFVFGGVWACLNIVAGGFGE